MALDGKFNAIDADKIVREQIKRELKSQQLAETFTFNPRTTHYISEKPTAVSQAMFETDESFGGRDRDLLATASVTYKVPREKYDFPVTEAQEIGWHAEALMPASSRFTFRSRQSEMTKHANAVREAHWENIRR